MIGIGLAFFGISVDVLILFLEFHYVILFVGFIMPIVSVDFCKTWIGQSNKKMQTQVQIKNTLKSQVVS